VLTNGIRVKEESSASICLEQKVGSKSRYPLEDREPSTGFENEKRNGLLEKKANNDCRPNTMDQ
jgi:hypothetical protein